MPTPTPLDLARLHRATAVGEVVDMPGVPDDLAIGGGFSLVGPGQLRRERTLPDVVGPDMAVLVCGLNPSLIAADAGYGYASPSNRFWPAALASGLVSVARDPFRALEVDGMGMTDLVKRATPSAAGLTAAEYTAGAARVRRLVERFGPRRVIFVGLTGWRVAVDRAAAAGWQRDGFGGVPAYVMPSTSGLNAHATPATLAAHFRRALA